jgi:hypothetical protein
LVPACNARKPNGDACQAKARTGSEFCFFHDPDLSEARRQAQCRGGRKHTRFRVIPNRTLDFEFSDATRITKLLEYAANRLIQGELDQKSAYVLGYLADCALRAHKVLNLEQQIKEMQRLIDAERNIPVASLDFLDPEFDDDDIVVQQSPQANHR